MSTIPSDKDKTKLSRPKKRDRHILPKNTVPQSANIAVAQPTIGCSGVRSSVMKILAQVSTSVWNQDII